MVICIKVPTFFKHNISSIASVNFYCPRCDFERFKFDKGHFFVELDSFPNNEVHFFKRRPQNFNQISQLIWNLFSMRQINCVI